MPFDEPKDNKKIMFFCPTDTWGGVEKNVLLRCKFLADKGYRIWVVLLKGKFQEKFKDVKNVSVINVNSRGGDLNVLVVATYVKLLKRIAPDVVFSALKKDWWLVSLSAYLSSVPRTILYLGIKRKIKNSLKYKLVFNTFKAIVLVNSDSLKRHLLESTRFFDAENLFRIYNGFQIPESKEIFPVKKQFNLPEDSFIVGSVGRMSVQKGYDQLPRILEQLPKNVHMVHVGTGALEEEIKKMASSSNVTERIHFLGQKDNVNPVYRAMDAFLLCSRYEGMANVVNEALSHGVPVVSTRVDGSEELLDHGTYGILTDIDDVSAMAQGILDIYNNNKTFHPEELQDWIQHNFSMERMVSETEHLLFSPQMN